jgi:hypothetical protein
MSSNSTQFHCRFKVSDQMLQDLTVFVWELEPLDGQTRSAREWIEEHIENNYEDLLLKLGIKGSGGWEAVFVATIRASVCNLDHDYDEGIELVKWQVQALPSEDD